MSQLMDTKTIRYNTNLNELIANSIDVEDNEGATLEDKITYVFERFESEYDFEQNKRRYPNVQTRLAEYLMGLPFGFPFYNWEILKVTQKLHEVDSFTEKQEGRILENYWRHIAFKLLQLKTKFESAPPA